MKAYRVSWTKRFNILHIKCACDNKFKSRIDRWKVKCRICGRIGSTTKIRNEYVRRISNANKKKINNSRKKRYPQIK